MRITIGRKEGGRTIFESPEEGEKATHSIYGTFGGYVIRRLQSNSQRLPKDETPLIQRTERPPSSS